MVKIKGSKRRWLSAIPFLAALLVLVGCGGNDADNKIPDNPAPLPDPNERIEG